jgi:glucokinase
MTAPAIGLDIGGSKLAAALIDPAGQVTARHQAGSPAADGPEAMVAAAAELVNRVMGDARRMDGPRPAALGVATAGVVDPAEGFIRSAVATIKDWAGVPLRRMLEELTGLPTAVENDVNAMALAETCRGAARGARSALVVAVGTGIGGALVVDGKLRRGRTGSAGEVGHIPVNVAAGTHSGVCSCGRPGHLEAVAAGPAIAAHYAALSGRRGEPALEDVGRACRNGDPVAAAVVDAAGTVVGRALGGLCNVLDPEVVVLAGGVLGLGPPLLKPLIAALLAEALPGPSGVAVRVSTFGENAGLVGAGIAALARVHSERRAAHVPADGPPSTPAEIREQEAG